MEAFRGLRRASPAERRSSRIVVGLRHRPSSGLQAIEPGEQVFDVGRQILRRNVLGGPSQGRADAGEEVDIVDASGVFRVLHFHHDARGRALPQEERAGRGIQRASLLIGCQPNPSDGRSRRSPASPVWGRSAIQGVEFRRLSNMDVGRAIRVQGRHAAACIVAPRLDDLRPIFRLRMRSTAASSRGSPDRARPQPARTVGSCPCM